MSHAAVTRKVTSPDTRASNTTSAEVTKASTVDVLLTWITRSSRGSSFPWSSPFIPMALAVPPGRQQTSVLQFRILYNARPTAPCSLPVVNVGQPHRVHAPSDWLITTDHVTCSRDACSSSLFNAAKPSTLLLSYLAITELNLGLYIFTQSPVLALGLNNKLIGLNVA